MQVLADKLILLGKYLRKLDETFKRRLNYTDTKDYNIYSENIRRFEELINSKEYKYENLKINAVSERRKEYTSFADEIYHQAGRQMKLADIIEYIFFSRGIYFLFQGDRFKEDRIKIFLEIILRFVNLLMTYETLTIDSQLRTSLLNNLNLIIREDYGFEELEAWHENVGLPKNQEPENSPNEYFDSILPKTAGGLWHEMLVFAFILKYDLGYIFPLFINQKPISLNQKLSPPDLILLHKKTYRYYGIEIGNLKERQSGGFMAPSGIPVIPIDTLNARISDRCPICKKWIGICPKVIKDFSNIERLSVINEVRCFLDCEIFSLEEKVTGQCPYMKFSKKSTQLYGIRAFFLNGHHYHYRCCIEQNPDLIQRIRSDRHFNELMELDFELHRDDKDQERINELRVDLQNKFVYAKTHSVYYQELIKLIEINKTIHE